MTPKEKLTILFEARPRGERADAGRFQVARGLDASGLSRPNHALWFAGHMAAVRISLFRFWRRTRKLNCPAIRKSSGWGARPSATPRLILPPEEVLTQMKDRRQVLMSVLDSTPDAVLDNPPPPGAPDFMKDIGSTYEMLAWHEGIHTGQLSVARRALGHQPIFSRPAPQELAAAK